MSKRKKQSKRGRADEGSGENREPEVAPAKSADRKKDRDKDTKKPAPKVSASGKLKQMFSNVTQEAKKTTWPTRQELIESTVVVIVSVVILAVFVGVFDKVLVELLKAFIKLG